MTASDNPIPSGDALAKARAQAQEQIRALRKRKPRLDDDSIDVILNGARSHYAWDQSRSVSKQTLEAIYNIVANGATSMNCCPARFVFIESASAREKLAKSLKEKNISKMMGAPVSVIVAHDLEFWRELTFLFPHEDRRHLFEGKTEYCEQTAFRNGTLQGAYFMIAARALGLDVGAMSGFSNAIVDQEFFAGTSLRSNFIINMGYADESAIFQKLPRFSFDQACSYA